MANSKVLVVVPCYNEAERFPKEEFLDFAKREENYRFLFVDDGSKDHTFDTIDSLRGERADRFDVLKLDQNFGKAEAVRRGFLKSLDQADAKYIAFWDADLATPLQVLPSFLITLEGRPQIDMVLGSRVKLMGHDIKRHEIRHYLGRIFATLVCSVLKLSIYDTQCGAKMFRVTDTLKEIFKEPFHSRWIFDVELIARYVASKKKSGQSNIEALIYEFPLPIWHDIAGSKLRPHDFLKAIWELNVIYRKYR
ncbi:MAG: glycosyltransferase [Candidatus Omnitrophica bacterium]|nr:glycosyltransferase [Candidatus Omnitrophota bacterium]